MEKNESEQNLKGKQGIERIVNRSQEEENARTDLAG
jgi:hypothetical protein